MNLPENRYNSRVKLHCLSTWHKVWYTRSVGKDLCCMNVLNEFCIITFSFFEMMSKVIFSPPSISCPFIYMYKTQSSKLLHLWKDRFFFPLAWALLTPKSHSPFQNWFKGVSFPPHSKVSVPGFWGYGFNIWELACFVFRLNKLTKVKL